MKNYETEQYTVAGLLVGGFTILGMMLGAITGFLIGGGPSEFLNNGWIWTVSGLTLGALLSAGLGLIGLAIHVKNGQQARNDQTHRNMIAGLLFGGFVILSTTSGALIGFVMGGGATEFLNHGWIWKIAGLVVGSILGSGIGLIGLAVHVKNNQKHLNNR